MVDRRDSRPAGSAGRLLALFGVLCVASMAIGVAMPAMSRDTGAGLLELGDVLEAHIVEIRELDGKAVLTGEFRSRVDALGNVEKDAALTNVGGDAVIGEVELEVPSARFTGRRPELEVDIMGLPPKRTFAVAIDNRVVSTFVSDDRGSVDLELQEGEAPPTLRTE